MEKSLSTAHNGQEPVVGRLQGSLDFARDDLLEGFRNHPMKFTLTMDQKWSFIAVLARVREVQQARVVLAGRIWKKINCVRN
jgi:hypothetical protein